MQTLETDRLFLRDWEEADIPNAHALWGNNAGETVAYLMTVKNNYAVVLKEENRVIGTIGLNEDADGNPHARNVGIHLLEAYWNQGLMSEALAAVIAAAHEITPYLSYIHLKEDNRSRHIAQKFGFVYIKDFVGVQRTPQDPPQDFQYYVLKT